MTGTPDLRRTQELLWTLITAPTGVRPALEDPARRAGIGAPDLDDLIRGDEHLSAIDRLDIYANMYFYRLQDCLKEDYPRLAAALGADRFHNLLTDYLLRHPSHHPSLRHLGRHLPGFVAAHPYASEFPYAADLARLEWARVEAFDAPDAAPLSRDDLARLPPDRAGEARLTFVPAFALLRFDHDVAGLWRDLQGGKDAAHDPVPRTGTRRRTTVRVWRSDLIVYHQAVDEEEARCLDLLLAGEILGALCQQLAAGRSATKATERVGRLLQGWIDDGLLAGFHL